MPLLNIRSFTFVSYVVILNLLTDGDSTDHNRKKKATWKKTGRQLCELRWPSDKKEVRLFFIH